MTSIRIPVPPPTPLTRTDGGAPMDAQPPAGTASGAASHLLIHAETAPRHAGWSVDAWLRRLGARAQVGVGGERTRLAVDIRDLRGQRVLALDDAQPPLDVVLQAGTYHVTTSVEGRCRRYTVALAQGASVALHLPGADGRR